MKYVSQMLLDRGIRPPKAGRETWRVKQCPGLYLRVSATGAASWFVMYRVAGKQFKETLGKLAALPKVSEAVARAVARQEQARGGINPVAERRAATERAALNTVEAAVNRWFEQCDRDLKPKTVAGYRQLLAHDVLPRWGTRPLASIAKADVLTLLNDKAAGRERSRAGFTGGAVVQANRLLTRLRTFFTWAVSNDLLAADPTAGVRKPAQERARDRVLTDDEIKEFWAATVSLDAPRRVGALFRLLLLTGQRVGEVSGMRWSEIDLENRTWVIPSARTKNGKEHAVALSPAAVEVLSSAPRVAGRDLVFSAASGFGRAKRQLDAAMGDHVVPWVLHDLRRTATTIMARLGIAPHVADRVLNHTSGTISGVAAVYNKFAYVDERRLALEALGRFVAALIDGLPGHVVEAKVKLWLRSERERGEREAAGNNVVPLTAARA